MVSIAALENLMWKLLVDPILVDNRCDFGLHEGSYPTQQVFIFLGTIIAQAGSGYICPSPLLRVSSTGVTNASSQLGPDRRSIYNRCILFFAEQHTYELHKGGDIHLLAERPLLNISCLALPRRNAVYLCDGFV